MRLLFLAFVLLLTLNAVSVSADEFATVAPSMLDLTLDRDEAVIKRVSLTIHPSCVRPFKVDVAASDPDALVTNFTGVMVNGCGGDTSAFRVEFTGTGAPQRFNLQFVDAEFGGMLASIPVTINSPRPTVEQLMGLLIQQRAVVFQVSSSGCTTKDDFQVEVLESFPLQLRLLRIQEDPCDAFVPLGTLVRFTYRELEIHPGTRFRVVNPLATVEAPPQRAQ